MDRDEPDAGVERTPVAFERAPGRQPLTFVYESGALSVATNVSRLGRALASFLLPTVCLACGLRPVERFFDGGVCAACWDAVPSLDGSRCAICGDASAETTPRAELPCGRCLLDPPAFRRLAAAAPYRAGAREMLLAFKFRGADYLAPRLARLMVRRLTPIEAVDEVTCVPAASGAHWRGDHAAELLGAAVARELGLPFSRRRLTKARGTERQSALPLSRRAANVRGAFRSSGKAGAHVLLVDDVATSGATARECARALRKNGARTVEVWCFARASRDELDPTDA